MKVALLFSLFLERVRVRDCPNSTLNSLLGTVQHLGIVCLTFQHLGAAVFRFIISHSFSWMQGETTKAMIDYESKKSLAPFYVGVNNHIEEGCRTCGLPGVTKLMLTATESGRSSD